MKESYQYVYINYFFFQKSYIFQKRPLTPPRVFKQREYAGDLAGQVKKKKNYQDMELSLLLHILYSQSNVKIHED